MNYSIDFGSLQHSSINPHIDKTDAAAKLQLDTNVSVASTAAIGGANTLVFPKDQASLSTASTLLAQALSVSDVRTEKVANLQQAIASGTYNVSSTDVADKLLKSLLS